MSSRRKKWLDSAIGLGVRAGAVYFGFLHAEMSLLLSGASSPRTPRPWPAFNALLLRMSTAFAEDPLLTPFPTSPHISPHLPTSPHISPHLAGCLLGARAVLSSINSLELVAPEALGDCGGHCLEKRPWWKLGLGRQRRRRLELTEGSTAYAIALSSLAGLGFVSQVRDLHGSPRVSPGSHRISHLDHFLTPLLGLVRPPRRCSRPCSQRSSRAPAM